MFDQISANKRRSALLILGFVFFVIAAGEAAQLLLGFGWFALFVALVIALVGSFAAYWKSDVVALKMSHARPADEVEYARLHNLKDVSVDVPLGVYTHVTGSDMVRDDSGELFVLEDNLRTPSGVSYVLENREVMMRLAPELFSAMRVLPVADYT